MASIAPESASLESPLVAAAEALAMAPLRVSDIEAVARSRLLTVWVNSLLVESNHKLLGVVNARDGLRALLAAGNHEEALPRNCVMGIGYQWRRLMSQAQARRLRFACRIRASSIVNPLRRET